MDNTMTLSDEILEVRKTLFQDYINAREMVKRSAAIENLVLTDAQALKVLATARKNYRRREVQKSAAWFQRFTSNVEKYFHTVRLGNWGSFRDRLHG